MKKQKIVVDHISRTESEWASFVLASDCESDEAMCKCDTCDCDDDDDIENFDPFSDEGIQ